eukprot:GFYU01004615.1.p1 GENE.GFYU01004615.1~~GFYU01004615.1.p1  ORF type:complete len:366 (+),score=69.25 GFYU01004615.1:166-1263(+)
MATGPSSREAHAVIAVIAFLCFISHVSAVKTETWKQNPTNPETHPAHPETHPTNHPVHNDKAIAAALPSHEIHGTHTDDGKSVSSKPLHQPHQNVTIKYELSHCDQCCHHGQCDSAYQNGPGQCCGVLGKKSFCCPRNIGTICNRVSSTAFDCARNRTDCDRCCEEGLCESGFNKTASVCCGQTKEKSFCCSKSDDFQCHKTASTAKGTLDWECLQVERKKSHVVTCDSCCHENFCGPSETNATQLQCCGIYADGPYCCAAVASKCSAMSNGQIQCVLEVAKPVEQTTTTNFLVVTFVILACGGAIATAVYVYMTSKHAGKPMFNNLLAHKKEHLDDVLSDVGSDFDDDTTSLLHKDKNFQHHSR